MAAVISASTVYRIKLYRDYNTIFEPVKGLAEEKISALYLRRLSAKMVSSNRQEFRPC